MKKLFLTLMLSILLTCLFVLGISAATTNEFGTPETSDKIDLSGMAEDDDVYCVLFDGEEYHTYPSRYIVTNATTMAWNFNKINTAFGTSYDKTSVIRLQVPAHVTTIPSFPATIYGWSDANNSKIKVVEVAFPKDTIVSTFKGATFEKCYELESIIIPNTVTKIEGTNNFNACRNLKSIVFEEGSQVTSLPNNFLSGCLSLTEIVLPPSVTSIGSGFCGGDNSKITKLVLSPNLTTVTGGSMLNAVGYGNADHFIEIYMPGAITTGEGSTTGGKFIGRGNKGDLKKYVIYFTGTEEQAKALVAKYAEDISFCDANIVAYDPTKTSGLDYLGMDPYTTDITVNTNRVIVFGYSACDAFYNGEHTMSGKQTVNVTSYFEAITIGDKCTRKECGNSIVTSTIDPLFTYLGYSYTEVAIGGTYSMSQFYGINKDNITLYEKAINGTIELGIVVASVDNPLGSEFEGTNQVITASMDNLIHDYFGVKVTGITDGQTDSGIVFCAYVSVGDAVCYLDGGATAKTVVCKSYNDVKADGSAKAE